MQARRRRKVAFAGGALAIAGMATALPMAAGHHPSARARVRSARLPFVGRQSLAATSRFADVRLVVPAGPHAPASGGRPLFRRPPPRRGSALAAGANGIPAVALAAYEHAAAVLSAVDPGCHLSWPDLAAIGHVESDNGLYFGSAARVTPAGTVVPPILGPVLDGRDGFPAIPTTDGGRLEQGGRWARAVGPMQFLPSTWLEYAAVAPGGQATNPQNFWDAALVAGTFLCDNGGDLALQPQLMRAVYAYNHSASYVALVVAWAGYYGAIGRSAVSTTQIPVVPAQAASAKTHRSATPSALAVVTRAARASVQEGSFDFLLTLTQPGAGGTWISSGVVDTADRSFALTLSTTPFGRLSLRVVAGHAYVLLPSTIHEKGAGAGWVRLSARVTEGLPPSLNGFLQLLRDDVMWLPGELVGAGASERSAGTAVMAGELGTRYSGPVDLFRAGGELATEGPGGLAELLGTKWLDMVAAVRPDGLVGAVQFVIPAVASLPSGTVTVRFNGYGRRYEISAPSPATKG
jgi:membrane-bound lytic murein transglycosylase B